MKALKRKLVPNEQGFITNWLISGLKQEPFYKEQQEKHQIKYEQYLREVGIDNNLSKPPTDIRLKEKGCGDNLWTYYYSKNNWFVDLSNTCTVPTKIEAYAVTEIIVKECIAIKISVWTYSALDLWLDDTKICSIKKARYKPIQHEKVNLILEKGKHQLFVRLQNVGVRDTRNLFGIQLREKLKQVEISLPNREMMETILEAEEWLNNITYEDNKLKYNTMPVHPTIVEYDNNTCPILESDFIIKDDVKRFCVSLEVEGQKLTRLMEIAENCKPTYMNEATVDETHYKIYKTLGEVPYQKRGSGAKFSVFHVLARYATNTQTEKDREYILQDLKYIDERVDCSDFLVVGILRLIKKYVLDEKMLEAIKKTLLNYRYWMDEEGSDGMCFWSENHALMFNGSQMVAGKLYTTEHFIRSNRMGIEQEKLGEERCRTWLTEVEKHGFEEFISATYTAVTVVALLNLIDFGPEDISKRASIVLDDVLTLLSKHVFDGVIIGPQGRVYRDVIYPFKQAAQALVHFMNKELPTVVGVSGAECMWLSCLATTKYTLPNHLIEKMGENMEDIYTADHAEINLKKTQDYILTSVTSPRKGYTIKVQEEPIPFTTLWVKEMNISYHGKTLFEPGVYGYQQHMWYAALAKDCPIFVNHPGISTDDTDMRPGYWYGNGIFPAIKQKGNILGAIYSIIEEHPIHFTHLYWPTRNFDEVCQEGKWLFGRKGIGYIGVWTSDVLVPFNDILIDREYRVYSSQCAYVCRCSSANEIGDFQNFIESCKAMDIHFSKEKMCLDIKEEFIITFISAEDTTQYI